ncbi:MAG: enoyl-CoA hydratase/isomerase family protein [Deltaproteobacteria bacterium]|nr:enoyl-CoA hydratase/isomerase family protein [Deltaproteobacteria bacterium]
MAESRPELEVQQDGPLLRLRLQRPERRNSMTREMLAQLIAAIENAPDNEEVRVVVLSGEGEHFCAGMDLVAVNTEGDKKPRAGDIQRRMPRGANRLISAMLNVQLPIVCGVRGWASGLGCHLALASDFTIASETARFVEPFVKRGFTPDSGGTYLLQRLVGLTRAKQMLLLGRELDGRRAAEWGLVYAAVPDADLEGATEALVAELAGAATIALGLTKWLMHRALDVDLADALSNEAFALELAARSKDFKEGMTAFAQKRPPRYQGR